MGDPLEGVSVTQFSAIQENLANAEALGLEIVALKDGLALFTGEGNDQHRIEEVTFVCDLPVLLRGYKAALAKDNPPDPGPLFKEAGRKI